MGRKKIDEKEFKKHRSFRCKESDYDWIKECGDGSAQLGIDRLIRFSRNLFIQNGLKVFKRKLKE